MQLTPAAYETYPDFLKAAIGAFWERDESGRVQSLALLLSAREAWEAAADRAGARGTVKGALAGAAGAAAMTLLLRTVLGGPLGVILTGASVASLVALYQKHRGEISDRAGYNRRVITRYRQEFDNIREDYLSDRLRRDQRDLMVEGLFGRLLEDLAAQDGEVVSDQAEGDKTQGE